MIKNPFINAALASSYIVGVVYVMDSLTKGREEPALIMPMAILSLFVLSVSVMGFLFFGQPLQMYLNNDKKGAVAFFLQTVGTFALFTACFMGSLLFVG